MQKAVIVLSGGLDSTTLLYDYNKKHEVYALSFDYGQKHSKELEMAKVSCKELGVVHKVIDISGLGDLLSSSLMKGEQDIPEGDYTDENMKSTVVPNRNMIMLSIAMGWAISLKAKVVAYATHGGDHDIYPDCRPIFVEKLNDLAKVVDYEPLEIETPFLNITKGDIVEIGTELAVDYSKTWTCYKGEEKPCGKCGSCKERLEAFRKNGLEDPLDYQNN